MQFYAGYFKRCFFVTVSIFLISTASFSPNPINILDFSFQQEGTGNPNSSGISNLFLPLVVDEYSPSEDTPTPTPTQSPSPSSTPTRPSLENLIVNPWFRNLGDPAKSGLDGWSQETEAGAWSHSQKAHNPSPDQITGTAARWADGSGMGGGPGVDGANAFLYQVVTANPSNQTLQFQIWWIVMWIEEAKVTIYGSNSPGGPWTEVWMPFQTMESQGADSAWAQTPLMKVHLNQGHSYYKVELHGRYPIPTTAGVKYTGVFFTTLP